MAVLARELGKKAVLLPPRAAQEAALVEGISVYEEGLRDPSLGMRMNAEFRKMTLDDETLTPVSELSSAFINAGSGRELLFASSMITRRISTAS